MTSRCLFEEYLDRPDLTAAAMTADGWYRTGDLATIDADGFLRLTGRVKDIINRGGEKVPVAEIEQLLHEHPAVAEVAIVAMPDERLGERACAFVVRDPDFAGEFGLAEVRELPRRAEMSQALLARAGRDDRRDASHAEWKDPEVRPARAGEGAPAGAAT